MDKLAKVRDEIEKLKSQLLRGACSSQIAMETRCKEEAYNEVLAILDTMQEQHVKESAEIQHEDKSCEDNGNSLTKEPTSWLDEFRAKLDSLSKEEFEQLWGKYGAEEKEELVSSIWHDASEKSNEPEDVVIINPSDNTGEVLTNCTGVYSGRIWSYTSDLLNLDNPCKIGKNLQEEPVSEFMNTESMIESYKQRLISQTNGVKDSPLIDMCLASYKHGINEILDTLNLSNVQRITKDLKESVSEDLGDYINELSKQFPEVSFAKLSRIAVRVSRWQQNQDAKNKLPKVINRTDLDEFAYQCAYDLSNDWAIDNPTWNDVENACKLGANWQKKQDQSTIELAEDHAMFAGMEKMKEEMMEKAVDAELYSDGMLTPLIGVNDKEVVKDIKFGDKIKLIIIKDKKDI